MKKKHNPHHDIYVFKHITSDSYCKFLAHSCVKLTHLPYEATIYMSENKALLKLRSIQQYTNTFYHGINEYDPKDFIIVQIRLEFKEVKITDTILEAIDNANGIDTISPNKKIINPLSKKKKYDNEDTPTAKLSMIKTTNIKKAIK